MGKDLLTAVCIDDRGGTWAAFRCSRAGVTKIGADRLEWPEDRGETGGTPVNPGPPGSDTVLVLPPSDVLLRILRLPTTDASEIQGMLDLQVDRVSPFSAEQTVFAFETLQAEADGVVVCLALARKSVIEERRRLLAGRNPVRVDAGALGLWAGLLTAGQLASASCELLLVVESSGVQLIVHQTGIPAHFLYIKGPFDTTVAADREEIAGEAARLFWTLDKKSGDDAPMTATVWVAPEQAEVLAECVSRHCGCACRTRDIATLPAVCDGAASRACATGKLDLTPPAWRESAATLRFRRRVFGAVAGLLALWVILAGSGYLILQLQRQRVEELRSADRQWLAPANRVRNLRRRAAMLVRYSDREDSVLEVLRAVALAQPQGVDLNSFTYRRGEAVDLSGLADTAQQILAFNAALNRVPLFETVIPGPRVQERTGRFRFSFELVMPGGRDDG